MKRVAIFALLVGLAYCAPTSKEVTTEVTTEVATKDDKLVIDKDFFPDEFKVFTSEHEIVSLVVPLNALNFDDDDDDDDASDESTIFYVEADVKDGVKEYKGLYVLKNKVSKKLLETGTDAAAANDDTKVAYFGATDGIYIYNVKENTAEKYGPITDSIINIAKVNGSDLIYILTDKNELYKVTENATKKELVSEVVGAKQIVLDYSNNLYYYNAEKEFYALSDGVKKIEGLPANPTYIYLLKPPFIMEDSVPVILDNKAYAIYANGTSEPTDFEFTVKPSAFAMEATLIQYFAYEKGIYEYNILAILLEGVLDELKTFLEDKTDEIQAIASRSRSDLRA